MTKKSLLTLKAFAIVLIATMLSTNLFAQSVSVSENFDNNPFPPTGWTTGTTPSNWGRSTNGGAGGALPATAHTGAAMARFRVRAAGGFGGGAAAGTSESLITPMFDMSGVGSNTASVSFWIYRDSINITGADSISIYINATNSLTGATRLGVVARAYNMAVPAAVAHAGWYQYSFNYPASFNTTSNYLLFNGTSQGGRSIYIDDVNYDTYPPACTSTPSQDTIMNSISTICGGSGSGTLTLMHPITGVSGITYTWQSSTSASGPWAPLVGATNSPTVATGTLTSTTYFQCVVGCNSHGSANTLVDSIVVRSNTPPSVTVNPTTMTVCSGTPTTLTASGASTYSWTPATNLSAPTGSSVIASPIRTGGGGPARVTYIVTGTDAFGCTDTAQAVFTVNATPNATITSSIPNDTICAGTTVTLSVPAAGGGGGGGPTYLWSDGTATRTDAVSPTTTTTYSITVTNPANAGGCIATDSVKIVVNSGTPPTVTVTPATATYCTGSSPVMVVATTTGGVNSYSWTPATGLNATNKDTVYAAPTGGGFGGGTVYTVVVSNGVCSASATTTITRSTTPAGNITTNLVGDSACTGAQVILTGPAGGGGGGGYTYAWSNGISTRRDTIANISSTASYTLVISNAAGCTKNDTINITVLSGTQPVLTLTPNGIYTLCSNAGTSVNLTVSGASTYSWTGTGLSANTGSSVVATPTAGPPSVYTVIGADASGLCKATASVTITLSNPPAKATIGVTDLTTGTPITTDSVCAGTQVILRPGGGGFGGNTYLWNDSKTTISDTTIINAAGLHTVTVTNNGGCSTIDSIMTYLLPGINAHFTYVINGLSVAFTDGTTGATSWSWTFGDGNSSANQNPTETFATAGTYYVTLVATGTGSIGCNTGSKTDTITVGNVGINNLASNSFDINVYPNPTTETVNMNFNSNSSTATLSLMNAVGQMVLSKTIYSNSSNSFAEKISLKGLVSGIYLMQIKSNKGTSTVKIIKE